MAAGGTEADDASEGARWRGQMLRQPVINARLDGLREACAEEEQRIDLPRSQGVCTTETEAAAEAETETESTHRNREPTCVVCGGGTSVVSADTELCAFPAAALAVGDARSSPAQMQPTATTLPHPMICIKGRGRGGGRGGKSAHRAPATR